MKKWATSGGDTGPSNRIALLRDSNGDGAPDTFLDHLNSPFVVALVGDDLHVADTDAIVRYPYTDGDAKIDAPGVTLTELPGGLTGPTGLAAVLFLADAGIKCRIVERGLTPSSTSRAHVVNPRTLELLESTGVTVARPKPDTPGGLLRAVGTLAELELGHAHP